MTEFLRLKHDEEERQKKEETRGISETGAERERNEATKRRAVLNKRKVDLLNKIIFPSMANLNVFLEYLTLNPHLHEIFDKDHKHYSSHNQKIQIRKTKNGFSRDLSWQA